MTIGRILNRCGLSVVVIGCAMLLSQCASVSRNYADSNIGNYYHQLTQAAADNQNANERIPRSSSLRIPGYIEQVLMPKIKTGLHKVKKAHRFDIAVHEMELHKFFSTLAQGTQQTILVSPKLAGEVTLNMRHITLADVFTAIEGFYGYDIKKMSYGYIVLPRQLETKVFTVSYLSTERTGGGGGGAGASMSSSVNTTISTLKEGTFWKNIKTNIFSIICSSTDKKECAGKVVDVNPLSNMVLVRAYPEELVSVSAYVKKMDEIINQQVIIEAKALNVELDAQHKSGIDWSNLTSALSMTQSSGLAGGASHTVAFTAGKSFSAVIKLLSTEGTVATMSSPRIATMNNQPAEISVGDTRYFAVGSTNSLEAAGSGQSSQVSSIKLEPFFSGVSLSVTPHINADNTVTLHIHPVISSVVEKNIEASSGGANAINLPTAETRVSQSDNMLRANDGQVVIIGGMMTSDGYYNSSSLPGVSNKSPLSLLTGMRSSRLRKSEMVILLRPIVVKQGTWSKQLRQSAEYLVGK